MTMPHLMNCPHSEDGWCLACVKTLWEQNETIEVQAKMHLDSDEGPWPLFCDQCEHREDAPFDYSDRCPACGEGKLRHEYDALLHTLDSYMGGGRFLYPAMEAARAIRWLRAKLNTHLQKSASR